MGVMWVLVVFVRFMFLSTTFFGTVITGFLFLAVLSSAFFTVLAVFLVAFLAFAIRAVVVVCMPCFCVSMMVRMGSSVRCWSGGLPFMVIRFCDRRGGECEANKQYWNDLQKFHYYLLCV